MAVLVLVYRTHLGEEQDASPCSLNRWIKDLRRMRSKLWDPQRQLVKNYNASKDFFELVLQGYILAFIANHFSCASLSAMKSKFINGVSLEEVHLMVDQLSVRFSQWDVVNSHRANVSLIAMHRL
jgi:hypothetical protein